MSLVGAILRATAFQNPLLRTVVPSVALAFGIQAAVAIPSIAARTERFYDLSGSFTYISCTALSLYLPILRARYANGQGAAALTGSILGLVNWRQAVISAAVGLWAARLGSYLFQRITSDNGQDSRFENIRTSPPKFFGAFMVQATWVSLCALPVFALNAVPQAAFAAIPAVVASDILGIALFAFGFVFEVTADRQKNAWVDGKKNKRHNEDFLTHGLWGKSRHPNYFGEICQWTGIAATAAGIMARSSVLPVLHLPAGAVGILSVLGLTATSPAFVTFLLTQVSGIPLSENKYDKRYGDRKDYQEWKKNTPVLIPKIK